MAKVVTIFAGHPIDIEYLLFFPMCIEVTSNKAFVTNGGEY